ncbi:hypothetical protein P154DRAFT_520931 [Amniculicola lignicola CBS 123094]|uniref:DUF7730 domain-containing protein n=1 Tax=Amniculicola lignicola CBS 123094 TaxID=1392246 RepID=A0A6A5WN62_9PLEO|nr:hypothetical protein P154DRAFT_520931 [Amniculicola lignicola CBS 123094]
MSQPPLNGEQSLARRLRFTAVRGIWTSILNHSSRTTKHCATLFQRLAILPFKRNTNNRTRTTQYVAYNPKPPNHRTPIPLPKTRPRKLSICATDDVAKEAGFFAKPTGNNKSTSPQSECMFLSKLPAEIRVKIYEYVLGNQVFHIIPSLVPSLTPPRAPTLLSNPLNLPQFKPADFNFRLDYEPCRSCSSLDDLRVGLEASLAPGPRIREPHAKCAIWVNWDGELYFDAPMRLREQEGRELDGRFLRWWCRKDRVLSLVRTGRLVYTEAVHVLYTQNTFSFQNAKTLVQFASTILPERLNSIRSLYIRFTFHPPPKRNEDVDFYRKACTILRGMQGLRKLLIVLPGEKLEGTRSNGGGREIQLLKELHDVKVREGGEYRLFVGGRWIVRRP